jgi:hypothetical protein
MEEHFVRDTRLGISIPNLEKSWESLNQHEQSSVLLHWEKIRGTIPDRIVEIEEEINKLQDQLSAEESFDESCRLNFEISSLASVINDLWLWYRLNQQVSSKIHG